MAGGGYGGQLVALNALLPSEQETLVGNANTASAQGRIAQATAPYVIAEKKADSELKTLQTKNATELDTLRRQYEAEQLDKNRELPAAEAAPEAAAKPTSELAPAASSAPFAKTPLFAPQIEAAMAKVNPKDPLARGNWDQEMAVLSKTVPQAKQFIGQFDNVAKYKDYVTEHQVTQIPAAVKAQQQEKDAAPATPKVTDYPTAAASPLDPTKRAIISPVTGKPSETLTRMMIRDPEGTSKILKMQSMEEYQRTGDLNVLKGYAPDVFNTIVTATTTMNDDQRKQATFGFETIGRVAQATIDTAQRDGPKSETTRKTYESGVKTLMGLGLINPEQGAKMIADPKIDWGKLNEGKVQATTVLQGMEQATNMARAQATAQNGGSFSYAGTSPEGTAMILNQNTGQIADSRAVVGAKPSATGSAFTTKQKAWLDLHPNDPQGALDFAGGLKAMKPQEAKTTALKLAQTDVFNGAIDPSQQNAKADQYYAEIMSTAPTNTPAAASSVGRGAPAPVKVSVDNHPALKNYDAAMLGVVRPNGFTNAQAIVAGQYKGTTPENVGSRDHPFIVRNKDELGWVPQSGPKSWWVGPDGKLTQGRK